MGTGGQAHDQQAGPRQGLQLSTHVLTTNTTVNPTTPQALMFGLLDMLRPNPGIAPPSAVAWRALQLIDPNHSSRDAVFKVGSNKRTNQATSAHDEATSSTASSTAPDEATSSNAATRAPAQALQACSWWHKWITQYVHRLNRRFPTFEEAAAWLSKCMYNWPITQFLVRNDYLQGVLRFASVDFELGYDLDVRKYINWEQDPPDFDMPHSHFGYQAVCECVSVLQRAPYHANAAWVFSCMTDNPRFPEIFTARDARYPSTYYPLNFYQTWLKARLATMRVVQFTSFREAMDYMVADLLNDFDPYIPSLRDLFTYYSNYPYWCSECKQTLTRFYDGDTSQDMQYERWGFKCLKCRGPTEYEGHDHAQVPKSILLTILVRNTHVTH